MTVSRTKKTEIGSFFNSQTVIHAENNIIKLIISLYSLFFTPLVPKKSHQVKSKSSELTLDIALMSPYTKRWIWEHWKPSVVPAQLRQALFIGQSNIAFHKFPQNTMAAPQEPRSADWYCPSWKNYGWRAGSCFLFLLFPVCIRAWWVSLIAKKVLLPSGIPIFLGVSSLSKAL